jgi:hypothetical protein
MVDAGCEWLIGLYLLQHALPNIFQQRCPDALQAWASQLASIFASKKLCTHLNRWCPRPLSSLQTQPEYQPNSVTNWPWDLKNFGWVEEISFTPSKPFACVGCGVWGNFLL